MSGVDLARAVKREAARAAVNERNVRIAQVTGVSPLSLELLDSRHTLYEENLTFTQDFKSAMADLAVGDTVMVIRHQNTWLCFGAASDVVAEGKATKSYVDAADNAQKARLTTLEKQTQPDRKDFGGGAILNVTTTNFEPVHSPSGGVRRFSITPDWDAWIEMHFHTIAICTVAAWTRVDAIIEVTPAPPLLPNMSFTSTLWGRSTYEGHNALSWITLAAKAWIPLSQGVSYLFRPIIDGTANTYQMYQGSEYSYFEHGGLRART